LLKNFEKPSPLKRRHESPMKSLNEVSKKVDISDTFQFEDESDQVNDEVETRLKKESLNISRADKRGAVG
jgi:hypothetical protein